jgi:hypothetical protein
MTTIDNTLGLTSHTGNYCERPAGGLRFDWPAALLALWLMLGMFLDGFAHHNLPESLETFFTPWHGILYSGFLALAGFILFHQSRNMARGYAWNQALPAGYSFALLGITLFGLGGVGDLVWHTLFGIEEGVEALLSPTPLLLATGGILLTVGPFRAALHQFERGANPGWKNPAPAFLSALLFLSVLTFFIEYANTLVSPERVIENSFAGRLGEAAHYLTAVGVAGVLLPTAFVMGLVLFIVRRWSLPRGALALIVGGNSLFMSLFHYHEMATYPQALIPIVASGLIAELGYAWLKPSPGRERALRAFAFAVPLATYGLFFVTLILTSGVWWSIHMWAGVPIMAGVVGVLMSLASLQDFKGL